MSAIMAERSPGLPSGHVTFVFTDIEGSTKIVKHLPDDAAEIFERHNQIIRSAIDSHAGHEVGTDGDAFFAAFEKVEDALAACATAQQALAEESWPEGGEVLVRMGVHAGLAAPRNDNYVALAVHQAARVVAAAHGGQIMVSDTALRGAAPPTATRVVNLGRYRIRDFDEPEVLHRLDPDAVAVPDRPPRATPAGGHNLVRPPTSFIGRGRAIDDIVGLISTERLVSLVGPGGTGKTRLAIEVGLRIAADWTDGVWLVELADLADSSLVPAAFADAVQSATTAESDAWADVLRWAEQSRSLIIVDNVEAHLPMCGELVGALLRFSDIAVMATGREPLQIAGESVYRVASLDLPSIDDGPAVIRRSAAVELFLDRAGARRPGLPVDDATVADIARLCGRLDGLPLAIEIAAARVSVMSIREIIAGLDDRFCLLRSSERSLPARQRTMRDLLTWSYDLLESLEKTAFRRLAVFGGTFTVDAAVAAIAADDLSADDAPEYVWALVDKSLVVADLTENGTRYRLLETVREFAGRLLVEHGDAHATARRSAAVLLDRIGPWHMADRKWIGEVGDELPNIRALLARLAPHDCEQAQALACSLARHHDAVQSFDTGIEELTRAVATLDARTPTRVAMVTALADLHLRRADTASAARLLDDASTLQDEVGPPEWNDAAVDRTRGEILCRADEYDEAAALAKNALTRGLSPLGQARMNNLAGIARYSVEDMTGAFDAFTHELEIYQELGFDANIASAHANLAEIAMQLGDSRAAATHQQACLDLALAIGQPVMLAYSSLVGARLVAELGDWVLTVRLLASAGSGLADAGHKLYPADQAVVDDIRSRAVEQLGEDAVVAEERRSDEIGPLDAASMATTVFTTVRVAPIADTADPSTERKPS
jgi:predicted ATPase/class 3 adenylate cyclase